MVGDEEHNMANYTHGGRDIRTYVCRVGRHYFGGEYTMACNMDICSTTLHSKMLVLPQQPCIIGYDLLASTAEG